MSIRLQEQMACLLIGAASIWGVHVTLSQFSAGSGILFPQVQVEVASIGFLVWLHAKWRRSVSAK